MSTQQSSFAHEFSTDAPWAWLHAGWRDMMRAPLYSLGYGLVFVLVGGALTFGLWRIGLSSIIPATVATFALVGPVLAVGLYEISRRLEAGAPLTPRAVLFVKTKSPSQIAFVAFFLMFGVLVWMRMATLLYAMFSPDQYAPLTDFLGFALSTPEGLLLLVVGTLTGGVIAFGIFLVTVFSIPMMMDQEKDAFTAIAASVEAVKRRPGAMLLWAWLIAIITFAGVATFFVGLAVAFPLLGHATWHAYRHVICGVPPVK